MRVYWSNGILKLESESKDEREALKIVSKSLRFAPAGWKVKAGIVSEGGIDGDDKDTVVAVE